MKLFFKKKKQPEIDPLEQRLDTISELTRGLERTEFNNLMQAVEAVFEARLKLAKVKTKDEKEYGDIDDAERKLEKEKENK